MALYKYAVIVVVVLAILVYLFFDPERSAYFPKCYFSALIGWECPSCGTQRALHAALNGEFKKAFNYNPFLFVAIPYAIGLVYGRFFKTRLAKVVWKLFSHKYSVHLYIIAYFAWWIIRNCILIDVGR